MKVWSVRERTLSGGERGVGLGVVADEQVNPTYTADLAPIALELGESGLGGVVHVVAAGCAGWDEFARAVLAELDVTAVVESASSAEFAGGARRPLNGCLGSSLVPPLRPWREGLHEWAARRIEASRA